MNDVVLTILLGDLLLLFRSKNVIPALQSKEPFRLCITHIVVKLLVIDLQSYVRIVINGLIIVLLRKAGADALEETYEDLHVLFTEAEFFSKFYCLTIEKILVIRILLKDCVISILLKFIVLGDICLVIVFILDSLRMLGPTFKIVNFETS